MIVDEAEFDADRWYRILQDEKVTVWYTAPTAIRMLMKAGGELPQALRPRPSCALPPAWANRSTPRPWCGVRKPWACPSMTIGGRPKPAES